MDPLEQLDALSFGGHSGEPRDLGLAVTHPAVDEERGVVDRDERVDIPAQRLIALDHRLRQARPERVSDDVEPAAEHEVAFVAQARAQRVRSR